MVDGFVSNRKDKVSVLIREQGKRSIHADTWWMGSDDEVRASRERANKILKAIQEISANKRAAVGARDYGPITDTDALVRIMRCDPFRRPCFSPQDRRTEQTIRRTSVGSMTRTTRITPLGWASLEV